MSTFSRSDTPKYDQSELQEMYSLMTSADYYKIISNQHICIILLVLLGSNINPHNYKQK